MTLIRVWFTMIYLYYFDEKPNAAGFVAYDHDNVSLHNHVDIFWVFFLIFPTQKIKLVAF